MMRAGRLLCRWLEDHVESFRLRADDKASIVDQLKRLSEFSLILIYLTCTQRHVGDDGYEAWAQRIAQVLWNDLHAVEGTLLMAISSARSSTACAMLLAFPALESVTQRRFDSHDQVMEKLAHGSHFKESVGMDLAFARDVAELHDCRVQARSELTRIIERSATSSVDETAKDVYGLTHVVFYATKMGQRPPGWDRRQTTWIHERLEKSGTNFLHHRDLDIVGESVTSLIMTGSAVSRYVRDGVDTIAATAETEGSIPAHPRHHDEIANAFANRYHSTLVGLATLAAFEAHTVDQ